ncbi:MAG: hypothetical protein ACK52I_28410 [Pseudomonadota bacterium]|jgi:hypothetical protein
MEPDLIPYRALLQPSTLRSFDLHIDAAGKPDWLAAGVWGAVFLESFLEEVMRARAITLPDRLDLGGAISRLRAEKDLPHLRTVLDRCESIRLARNALVHAGPLIGDSTVAHAQTIGVCLREVIRLAEAWFPSPVTLSPAHDVPGPSIGRVFVSTITPHLPRQASFVRDLSLALRRRQLAPVFVLTDEFDANDPMGKVLSVLRTCDALLCIGLERSHAFLLREKEGSKDEKETAHGYFSSGWLNMEAGAGFALGMPVVVLCEPRIKSEGIFDRTWNSSPPYEMASTPSSVTDPAVQRCLTRLEELVRTAKLEHVSGPSPVKKPLRTRSGASTR